VLEHAEVFRADLFYGGWGSKYSFKYIPLLFPGVVWLLWKSGPGAEKKSEICPVFPEVSKSFWGTFPQPKTKKSKSCKNGSNWLKMFFLGGVEAQTCFSHGLGSI